MHDFLSVTPGTTLSFNLPNIFTFDSRPAYRTGRRASLAGMTVFIVSRHSDDSRHASLAGMTVFIVSRHSDDSRHASLAGMTVFIVSRHSDDSRRASLAGMTVFIASRHSDLFGIAMVIDSRQAGMTISTFC